MTLTKATEKCTKTAMPRAAGKQAVINDKALHSGNAMSKLTNASHVVHTPLN